ncbi:MAG: lipase, partial [Nevskia sp.]|nr:lipase [Nevskia sp.]
MDFIKRLDPELAVAFAGFAAEELSSLPRLLAVRRLEAQGTTALRANRPRIDGVVFEDREISSADGSSKIALRLYRPSGRSEPLPALLWLHGGGYLLGNIESDYLLCSQIARDLDCVVLAVDYRLAPEHPYPAAFDDARAALAWLYAQADALGALRTRIAIGGASAGGGLAACLALLNRDRGGIELALQLLIYPMLDDRNRTPSSYAITDGRVWDRAKNLYGWRSYLGDASGGEQVSHYAAAARTQDLSGLPPSYVAVGSLDL